MSDVDNVVEIKSVDEIISLIPDDQRDKVKDSVVGYFDSVSKKEMTSEDFKTFAKNNANDPSVSSVFDSRVSLAVNTYEENFKKDKLPKMLEEEIKKRFPTKSQEEIENAELKEQLNNFKAEMHKKEQINIALQKMDGLPEGINPGFLVGDTDEETINNVQKFKETLITWRDESVKAKDQEWLAKTADNPQAGVDGDINVSYADATMDQRNAYFEKYGNDKFNNWSKQRK